MSRLRRATRCCTDPDMKLTLRGWIGLGFLAVVAATLVGCKTEDELTERPWNTPRSWESGLPSAITEGR